MALQYGKPRKAPRLHCDHCFTTFHDLFHGRCPVCLAVYHIVDPAVKKRKQRGDLPGEPAGTRQQVYERDGYRCVACGSTKQLTLDHRVPRCRGGTNALSNLQTMCSPCNNAKGHMMPDEWEAARAL